MKHHSDHPWGHGAGHEAGLSGLFDRCSHYLAHRIGSNRRGRESVMAVIARQPGISQKELAEALDIQPASVSELMMKLEQKGLIFREQDAQDRRSRKVRLTEAGIAQLAEPKEDPADPFRALSDEEQAQLQALLEKLLADWEQRYPAERERHHGHHPHKHHERSHHDGKHE